jgi:glycosyltransferase involved in cell wall biosynthesis
LYPLPRLLLEEHGRFYPEVQKPVRLWVNRLLISRLTERFVAVSQDVARRLERFEGVDRARIEVIYNGVPAGEPLDPAERRALRAALGFTETDFVVGTVGRFDEIKNLPMLIESLAMACARLPSLRGLLVGDGPMFDAIRGRVRAEGLEGRVRLTGYRSDARRLTQCLDLFVLSSLSEGTSMALLEAMSAAFPVAVTDVGGNPEIVCAGESGWLVPSRSADALASVLIEAAGNPGKCRQLGSAARRRVEERFSMARMLQAYRECYHDLLRQGGLVGQGA